MDYRKIRYNLSIAAVCLLALTFVYMYIRDIPLSRMPVLVWVLFGLAIIFPLFKARSRKSTIRRDHGGSDGNNQSL